MDTNKLSSQIYEWIEKQPYWLQHAGTQILDGAELNDDLFGKVYTLFKEDVKLQETSSEERTVLDFSVATSIDNTKVEPILLKSIQSVKNVNALAPEQTIECGKGLTVIYGDNGTGKSGYTRLLNNAFQSRGDSKILPNVFGPEGGDEPQCEFVFAKDEVDTVLKYPEDKDKRAFSKMSIFDSHSIDVHLEKKNSLNFTPSGFWFFNQLISVLGHVEALLVAEANSKDLPNAFLAKFANQNEVGLLVGELEEKPNLKRLEELAKFDESNDAELTDLSAKKAELDGKNIPAKIIQIGKTSQAVKSLKDELSIIVNRFGKESYTKYKNAISKLQQLEAAAAAEGSELLKHHSVIDSDKKPWKDFAVAAQSYISSVYDSKEYPELGDSCIFCHQELSEEQVTLISTYWKFLKSESENELRDFKGKISTFLANLDKLKAPVFEKTGSVYSVIAAKNESLASSIEGCIELFKDNKLKLKDNMESGVWKNVLDEINFDISALDEIIGLLQKQIEDLSGDEVKKTVNELSAKIELLRDRFLLSKTIPEIRAYRSNKDWAKKALSHKSKLGSRKITTLQKDLFNEHITAAYTSGFSQECSLLGAPTAVSINQKPSKGTTMRSLLIKSAKANQVLSEGEQRAVAIADFLTESLLNPHNDGVIFDDPVTSQDHRRKARIGSRIVELAKEKQVIVFTHDIPFFLGVIHEANTKGVDLTTTTVRSMGGTPGIIDPQLPWIAQKSQDRLKWLRNRLVGVKKKLKTEHEDDCLVAVKTWYGLLREGWERAIEERLLKGVVERYRPSVQTLRLKHLNITDEMLDAISIGMTESSKLAHDSAAGLNPPMPTDAEMDEQLKRFEDFLKLCPAQ